MAKYVLSIDKYVPDPNQRIGKYEQTLVYVKKKAFYTGENTVVNNKYNFGTCETQGGALKFKTKKEALRVAEEINGMMDFCTKDIKFVPERAA